MSGTTPDQINENVIVRAGAGAGKTYALTHKVMDIAETFVREHGRFPRLIVTTFTRKATQELRERLMLLALEEKPDLVDFVNSRSHLVVSTIHGIMDMYLKRYGANICVDPAYRIIGGAEVSKLARQTLRKILLDTSAPSELLESFQFNMLVKLVRRIDSILTENPDACPFGAHDFDGIFQQRARRAIELFRETANCIRAETNKETWIEIATVCETLVKLMGSGSWSDNRELFAMAREAMPIARRNAKGAQPVEERTIELAKEARRLAGEFCEPLYDPKVWRLFAAQYGAIDQTARRFSADFKLIKIAQGFLEIGDLELFAMACIRQYPNTVEAFQKEWDHWLVDEYQDTSPFQVELIRNLSGDRPNFIVGDPQQSIYLFRGARSEVFAERENEILSDGGERKLLTVNRRSRPELLLFLNQFFSNFNPPFQAMEPFIVDGTSIDPSIVVAHVFVAQEPGKDPGKDKSAPTGTESGIVNAGDTGEVVETGEASQEMFALVRHVQSKLAEGASPEEICVLARTNRVLTDVATWLARFGLPTHVHVASGFYDRREIRDALALLKFLVNPHDALNLVQILRSPWFRVPDHIIVQSARQKAESLWGTFCLRQSSDGKLNAIDRLEKLAGLASANGISEAFRRGLIDGGFIDFAHTHDISGRREANIWKLLSRLQQEERRAGFNPLAFIARSVGELKTEDGNAEGDAVAAVEPNRINLMTIHASKGLEFKHVVLPRMEQRPRVTNSEDFTYDEKLGRWAVRVPYGDDHQMTASLPESNWLESFRNQELEEHARVLYVALTRASESVFLSWTSPIEKNSWAEMVGMDLTPGGHQEVSYCYIVESPVENPELPNSSLASQEVTAVRSHWSDGRKSTEVDAAQPLLPKEISVSEILDSRNVDLLTIIDPPHLTKSLLSRSRGTAVHKLMELIKYRAPGQLAQLISKWFPGQEGEVANALNFVREAVLPPLLEIIANGEVEKGFIIKEGSIIIPGQIDLWGRTNLGQVWIVDYKTGNPDGRESAFAQMEIYTLALYKSGLVEPNEEIQLAAIFPFAGKIFTREARRVEKIIERLRS